MISEILPIWVEEITNQFDSRPTASRTASLGILEEINFWRNEASKLFRIKEEVASDKIGKAINDYNAKEVKEVNIIKKFIIDITAKHQEAVSNQNFLGVLENPVREIHNVPMEELNDLFKNIFTYVFIIWDKSPFYSSS